MIKVKHINGHLIMLAILLFVACGSEGNEPQNESASGDEEQTDTSGDVGALDSLAQAFLETDHKHESSDSYYSTSDTDSTEQKAAAYLATDLTFQFCNHYDEHLFSGTSSYFSLTDNRKWECWFGEYELSSVDDETLQIVMTTAKQIIHTSYSVENFCTGCTYDSNSKNDYEYETVTTCTLETTTDWDLSEGLSSCAGSIFTYKWGTYSFSETDAIDSYDYYWNGSLEGVPWLF